MISRPGGWFPGQGDWEQRGHGEVLQALKRFPTAMASDFLEIWAFPKGFFRSNLTCEPQAGVQLDAHALKKDVILCPICFWNVWSFGLGVTFHRRNRCPPSLLRSQLHAVKTRRQPLGRKDLFRAVLLDVDSGSILDEPSFLITSLWNSILLYNFIWQCVNPCSSHQNSWDLWMFIP